MTNTSFSSCARSPFQGWGRPKVWCVPKPIVPSCQNDLLGMQTSQDSTEASQTPIGSKSHRGQTHRSLLKIVPQNTQEPRNRDCDLAIPARRQTPKPHCGRDPNQSASPLLGHPALSPASHWSNQSDCGKCPQACSACAQGFE